MKKAFRLFAHVVLVMTDNVLLEGPEWSKLSPSDPTYAGLNAFIKNLSIKKFSCTCALADINVKKSSIVNLFTCQI